MRTDRTSPATPAPETDADNGEESGGRRTRWGIVLGLWSVPALVELSQRYAMQAEGGESISWPGLILMAGFWLAWALLTPVIFELTRKLPIRPPRRLRNLMIHAAAGSCLAVAFVALLTGLYGWQEGQPEAAYSERFVRGLASGYPTMMMVYAVLVTIGAGLDLRQRFRAGQLRAARLERRLAEAQLATLRMQLQPHFLFNTLHAISALMDEDVPAARRMIARLGELLRITLASNGEPEVSLEREIEVLERYLDIERVRLGDRLTVEYEVDDEALAARVPTLLLQPLVENAVRHGVAPVARPGRVRIAAKIEGEALHLVVEDDGPGMAADPRRVATDGSAGIGLANTRARLEQRYGADATFELRNGMGKGLTVSLRLPMSRSPEGGREPEGVRETAATP